MPGVCPRRSIPWTLDGKVGHRLQTRPPAESRGDAPFGLQRSCIHTRCRHGRALPVLQRPCRRRLKTGSGSGSGPHLVIARFDERQTVPDRAVRSRAGADGTDAEQMIDLGATTRINRGARPRVHAGQRHVIRTSPSDSYGLKVHSSAIELAARNTNLAHSHYSYTGNNRTPSYPIAAPMVRAPDASYHGHDLKVAVGAVEASRVVAAVVQEGVEPAAWLTAPAWRSPATTPTIASHTAGSTAGPASPASKSSRRNQPGPVRTTQTSTCTTGPCGASSP